MLCGCGGLRACGAAFVISVHIYIQLTGILAALLLNLKKKKVTSDAEIPLQMGENHEAMSCLNINECCVLLLV